MRFPHRRLWLGIAGGAVLLLVGVAVVWHVATARTADVHNGAKLPFTLTSGPGVAATTTHQKPARTTWGPSWPMYGRFATRTRDASDLTGIHAPFRTVWSAGVGFLEYPPVYAKGVLYIYANGGYLSARALSTGKLLWTRALLRTPSVLGEGAPAVHLGVVYVGTRAGRIDAISAKTGRTLWSTNVGAAMESSPAFDGRYLYMASQDGVVRALRLKDGHSVWSYHTAGAVKHGPALAGGRVFFGDYAGVMYCLNAANGHQVWRTATNGLSSGFRSGTFFSTPAVAYGRVYIGNTDDKLYSFVAQTGQVAWTYTFPDWAYGSPAVADGRVYETSFDGTFAALDARTGAVLWSHQLPNRSLASPTVIGDLVYVTDLGPKPSSRGHVYAYDRRDGRRVWSFGDGKYATPIVANGRLVVSGATRLYVLAPKHATS